MLDKRFSKFHKLFFCLLLCALIAGAAFAAISDYDFLDLCTKGSLEQILVAINDGANVNAKDNRNKGFTPLIYALASNPDPEVITALVNAGANVNARTEEGYSDASGITPLMAAVGSRVKLEVIKTLLDAGAEVNARNRARWTPLLFAAGMENSNPEMITLLINAGADVDAHNIEGFTPLIIAAERCSNPEVITVLLNSGANAAKKQKVIQDRGDEEIRLAIDYARENAYLNNTEAHRKLEEETIKLQLVEEKVIEFIELCKTGSLEQIKDAIENGVNVNARIEEERTPLMIAAWNNSDPGVIRTLISADADLHMKDEYGYTPLMFAANYNSNPEVSEILVKAGADINADVGGLTPLMIAALANANPKVVETLLECGANPKAKNNRDKDNMAIDYAKKNVNLIDTDVFKKLEEISM